MLYEKLREDFIKCIAHDINNPRKTKKVSCSENQKKVSFQIKEKEIGLVLVIDDNFSGRCGKQKKKCKNFKSSKKCDLLLYFSDDSVRNVIFIELKGTNISEAIEQIKHSIKYFEKRYNQQIFNYKFGAVLIHSGGSPSQSKDKELKNLIDLKPYFSRTNQGIIDSYIRKEK